MEYCELEGVKIKSVKTEINKLQIRHMFLTFRLIKVHLENYLIETD